jgi:hypothetical protein
MTNPNEQGNIAKPACTQDNAQREPKVDRLLSKPSEEDLRLNNEGPEFHQVGRMAILAKIRVYTSIQCYLLNIQNALLQSILPLANAVPRYM